MKRYSHATSFAPLTSSLALLLLACGSGSAFDGEGDLIETQEMQQALEADCEDSIYEAETMTHSTGGATPGGWNIWSNGYISTTHDFEGGTTQVSVLAAGQFAGGASPNMRITVGGVTVHQTGVGSSSWTPYNFTFEAAAGVQEVRIYFTNDYYQFGQDRNLLIDKLVIACGTGLCGNGAVNPGEECDDGSQTSADSCKLDCTWNVCGDGVLYTLVTDPDSPNSAEACDDGNSIDTDACTSACELAVCGDGFVHAGVEACDDGNSIDTDACANDCTLNAFCGDGIVNSGEECDDGNDVDTDACTTTCQVAVCGDGWLYSGVEECDDGNTIDTDACLATCQLAVCGDGIVHAGVEGCDDGNSIDTDACANDCTVNSLCGNGTLDDGEECDDGNTVDDDTCANDCTVNDSCGDGVLDAGEICDDGNDVDTDTCTSECLFNTCGDGFPYLEINYEGNSNPLEECDDGNSVDDDACSNSCEINPFCGDGTVDAGEECDDGNDVDDDACSNSCELNVCGDGVVNGGEECDDGNGVDDDACSNTCLINPFCGDGNVDAGEQCDDSNTSSGDGCDANCLVEPEPGVSATLTVTNQWPTGYCVTLNVKNEADTATVSWSAVVDTKGASIYTRWNGTFSGNSGQVGITPVNWNSVIAPGATNSSVGFCANRAAGGPIAEIVSAEGSY